MENYFLFSFNLLVVSVILESLTFWVQGWKDFLISNQPWFILCLFLIYDQNPCFLFFFFFSYREKTAVMLPVFGVFLSSQSSFYCHGRKEKNTTNNPMWWVSTMLKELQKFFNSVARFICQSKQFSFEKKNRIWEITGQKDSTLNVFPYFFVDVVSILFSHHFAIPWKVLWA